MHDRSGSHVPIATAVSTQVAQKRARPQGTNATPFRRPVRHTSQQSTACVVGACTRRRWRCDAVAFSSSSLPSSLDESSSRGNSAPVCAQTLWRTAPASSQTSVLYFWLEMCGNGFQHFHSLPFPSIQFPFHPIPIPNFWLIPIPMGFPCGLFPFPHSHSVNAKVVYSQWYGDNYDMFPITEILIIYYHYTKNVHILVQLQTSESGRWYTAGQEWPSNFCTKAN